MYYLIFSSYQDIRRTNRIHTVIFESNDSYITNEMFKFFSNIEDRQFHFTQPIDNYRKLTSIFYSDVRNSIHSKKQLDELNDIKESPETDIECKNEIIRFLHFLGFITELLSTLTNKTYKLEIISVEDHLPIDC